MEDHLKEKCNGGKVSESTSSNDIVRVLVEVEEGIVSCLAASSIQSGIGFVVLADSDVFA